MRLFPAVLVVVFAAACSEKSAPPAAPAEAPKAAKVEKPAEPPPPPPAEEAPKPALDACKLFDPADLVALLGEGAKTENIGDQQCKLKSAHGEYDIAVRAENGQREVDDWRQMTLAGPTPVSGVGDEAYADKAGAAIALRKGTRAARVNSSGVMPTAPMKFKDGVLQLAKKVAEKL